jgi:pyruvate formate lyase activating enzyme
VTIASQWWSTAEDTAAPAAVSDNASLAKHAARCDLCFRSCLVPAGEAGYCRVRTYDGRTPNSPYLGKFCSAAIDPIEKKPLRHWRPGSFIYSLGSVGCNMRCPFCQNHTIAQPDFSSSGRLPPLTECAPQALAAKVRALGLDSVAYTYNEPTLQAEYILAAAPLLQEAGIATVLVSNGMFSADALRALSPWVSAANIDVKSFNGKTYTGMGGSLETVMRTVAVLLEAGAHVEVTNLVVPGLTDSPEEFAAMTEWLASVSPDIPLHISRYFPANRYREPATSISLLHRFGGIAKERLHRVHIGNV